MSYFLDRFGEDATKALVAHDANGLESVDLVLRDALNLDLTHEDIRRLGRRQLGRRYLDR